ncbi:MAG: DUF177 domain-containing protein [Lachnospiraceae bacterium]|nr:DUF177 domain-containing protein [Lachnospiraceae bacterium]
MIIQLTDLYQVPGKTAGYDVMPDAESIAGYPILSCEPVHLVIHHEKDRAITVDGSISLVLTIPCDRCLKPVETTVTADLSRMLDGQRFTDEDGETVEYLEGDMLDAGRLIEEAVIENLPMKVLCREDCKGLCPKCGRDLNEGPCGCEDDKPLTGMGEAILKAFQNAGK